ncbi:MAG: FAD-dependent oxidoreductase, partial [Gammaproteobacteria bacterium]|nr:FAD-dependent oxidoreductase [Gammaproteobacteria bacterium]
MPKVHVTAAPAGGPFRQMILQILEDAQHRLWLTTNKGVFVAHRDQLQGYLAGERGPPPYRAYDVADGMRASELNGGNTGAGCIAVDGTCGCRRSRRRAKGTSKSGADKSRLRDAVLAPARQASYICSLADNIIYTISRNYMNLGELRLVHSATASSLGDAAVIGAGIVGVCCALSLQAEGFRVLLLDHADAGEACSKGNAGHIAVEQIAPLSSPQTILQVPHMLLQPNGPLTVRWSYLPRLLPWLVRFLLA